MANKKTTPDNLRKEFLVRLLDKDTIDLLEKALASGKYTNRNKLVNDCIKGYLTYLNQRNNPELTIKEVFEKEMSAYQWKIKRDLDALKQLILVSTTIQHFDDKAIGYLIKQFDNLLNNQTVIAPLPKEAVQSGIYDALPDRLEKTKQDALKEIISQNE